MNRVIILFCLMMGLLCFNLPAFAAEVDFRTYTEEQLQKGDQIAQQAINATEKGDFIAAEKYWTELIKEFPDNAAAWSNRGNARVSQNKLEEAVEDYNQAINIAPNAPDPYLNRGTALEGQKKYDEAIADFNHVLEINPEDAMAYNNRGNAEAGQGFWEIALQDYQKAADLEPNFAFARANSALVLYQIGEEQEAMRVMNNLVRKYPTFADMRAALTAALWKQGKQGEAESNWVAAVGLDNRYQDIEWVTNIRRWPPRIVLDLEKFLKLQ